MWWHIKSRTYNIRCKTYQSWWWCKSCNNSEVRKKPVDENDKDADRIEEESQEKSAVVSEADSQPEGEKEPESEIDASIDELLERAEKDKNE